MTTERTAGRIVGALILSQMVAGVLVNFVLTAPLFGSPGFLVNAAAHSSQIAASVLLGLVLAAISVGIAVTAFRFIRPEAEGMALFLLALATASCAVNVMEQIGVMSMVTLSKAYASAGAAERAPFQGLRIVVASARNWAHFVGLIMGGSTIFVFYGALYRSRLVPRALAACGMAAAALQIVVIARPLFGHAVVFPLLAPLGVSQLVLAIWLSAKGFRPSPVAT